MIDPATLSAKDLAFRDEVRTFFAENLTPELREAGRKTLWHVSEFEYGRAWQRILHARGWGAPHWPVEFGGTDWTATQRMIWAMENAVHRPPAVMNMGRDLCAPCIMAFGTGEQQARYLPRILSGEDWWAQGYSEPEAGSDLASLKLRAEAHGDDYVLDGSKIWTTMAQHATHMFCLVRTSREDRKQGGITFLLVDMNSPGIEIRPIRNLAGVHEFNQVFFTGARTPRANRLGEEGEGWKVARQLLRVEHGGNIYDGVELRRRLAWLEEIASLESDGHGSALIDDPDFETHIAKVAVACEASDAMMRLLIDDLRADGTTFMQVELLNIRRRELGQRLTELLMMATGHYGLISQDDALRVGGAAPKAGPDHAALPTAFFLTQRAATIAGGTAEIHRNNVARHLLGL
ncbi:MAG: acyl-CoA dehydrogenase family protein [Novosphingobium sp.]|nr:acyl-CoA dehydrogenase family protein [Novosphingobium sp.]